MRPSELRQFELLATMDSLRQKVAEWIEQPTDWEPVHRSQLLLRRVIDRVETLRVRMEAPLIVATFGGTGTGKSTLVNALLGEEISRTGRQRPTTTRPLLIIHPRTDPQQLGLPLEDLQIVQRDLDLLRDLVLIDCPDPDTSAGDESTGNLGQLRNLLPHCDVLLYVSTQQKYRSARVSEELQRTAAGCRILFIQTHADLDTDIRDDWRKTLATDYKVPEVFFVDSLKAIQEQQAGLHPTGELGQLLDLLTNKFGVSERVRVRRANVLELLHASFIHCRELLDSKLPALHQINTALAQQQSEMNCKMATQLQQELLGNRRLWERRLLSGVIDRWGFSPFSCVLRAYHGLGSLVASSMLFRTRSAAQLAILGTVQGARWLEGRREEQAAESSLRKLGQAGLDDTVLRESEIILRGHLSTAELRLDLLGRQSLSDLRHQAVEVETDFLGDASRRIDAVIQEQSHRNARWRHRLLPETILILYLGFVLYRVGKNFFYDSFLSDAPLLSTDFYLAASLFLALICAGLIARFTVLIRSGLATRIRTLTEQLVDSRSGQGLFPPLQEAVLHSQRQATELHSLSLETERLRNELADFTLLGGRKVRAT